VTLFTQLWGRFDSEQNTVDVHEIPEPGDGDLLDLAAIQNLIKGGRVYFVSLGEVPDQAYLAAVLLY
jgi:hypothetical protein